MYLDIFGVLTTQAQHNEANLEQQQIPDCDIATGIL